MSKHGMKIAFETGQKRKIFKNIKNAEKYFEEIKEKVFRLVIELQKDNLSEKLNYSPESLKSIEKIYFDYYENNKFNTKGITKFDFEEILGIYVGNVFVVNKKAKWIIEKEVFTNDNRYYLAIKILDGFLTIDCSSLSELEKRPNNKRKQSMYRDYKKYSS